MCSALRFLVRPALRCIGPFMCMSFMSLGSCVLFLYYRCIIHTSSGLYCLFAAVVSSMSTLHTQYNTMKPPATQNGKKPQLRCRPVLPNDMPRKIVTAESDDVSSCSLRITYSLRWMHLRQMSSAASWSRRALKIPVLKDRYRHGKVERSTCQV